MLPIPIPPHYDIHIASPFFRKIIICHRPSILIT
jgi:hypothetical protein